MNIRFYDKVTHGFHHLIIGEAFFFGEFYRHWVTFTDKPDEDDSVWARGVISEALKEKEQELGGHEAMIARKYDRMNKKKESKWHRFKD